MKVGDLHVLEGSHSAKFWIFDQLPSNTKVLDYNTLKFDQRELGVAIEKHYNNEFGKNHRLVPVGITHNPNISWQRRVINALISEGVQLEVEKLFTPEDYSEYKYKYGVGY